MSSSKNLGSARGATSQPAAPAEQGATSPLGLLPGGLFFGPAQPRQTPMFGSTFSHPRHPSTFHLPTHSTAAPSF